MAAPTHCDNLRFHAVVHSLLHCCTTTFFDIHSREASVRDAKLVGGRILCHMLCTLSADSGIIFGIDHMNANVFCKTGRGWGVYAAYKSQLIDQEPMGFIPAPSSSCLQ